jgi:hypothetical protein
MRAASVSLTVSLPAKQNLQLSFVFSLYPARAAPLLCGFLTGRAQTRYFTTSARENP